MSLFGNNSSSSSSTVNNTTNNQNVGAGDSSVIANEGSFVSVLDGGAVKGAFDFGRNALDFAGDANRGALDFATTIDRGALDLVGQINSSALDHIGQSFEKSIALVSDVAAKQTIDSGARVQQVVQYVIWGVVGLGVITLIGSWHRAR